MTVTGKSYRLEWVSSTCPLYKSENPHIYWVSKQHEVATDFQACPKKKIVFYTFNFAVNVNLQSPKLIYNLALAMLFCPVYWRVGGLLNPRAAVVRLRRIYWGWKSCFYWIYRLIFHSCAPATEWECRSYVAAGMTLSLSQLRTKQQQVVEMLCQTLINLFTAFKCWRRL